MEASTLTCGAVSGQAEGLLHLILSRLLINFSVCGLQQAAASGAQARAGFLCRPLLQRRTFASYDRVSARMQDANVSHR
jgi:hypothetical protein